MVKSRRARSSSSETPYSTTACRPSVSTSRRKVVTSCSCRCRSSTPTVPYRTPTGTVRGKSRLHLLRRRRGGEVVVHVGIAEQGVAHRAADAPGLEARALEHAGDVQHLLGNRRSCFMPAAPTRTARRPRGRWSAPCAPATGVRGPAGIAPIATVRAPPPSKAYTGVTSPAAQRLAAPPASRRRASADGRHRAGRQVAAAERLDHHAVVRGAGRVEQRRPRRRPPSAPVPPARRGRAARSGGGAAPARRVGDAIRHPAHAAGPNGAPKASSATVSTLTASRPCQIAAGEHHLRPAAAARLRPPPRARHR